VTTAGGSTTPVATPQARRRWLVRVLALLAIFGPGLISANAGNDAGGILTYASAGSQFAYRMLFLMVLITVGLVVVQEMCSRLGVYTGKGLGGLLREQFTVRRSTFALTLLLVANAGLTVSEFAGIGAAFDIWGVSKYVSIPIAAIAVWAMTVFGSYSKAERIFLILTLAFLSYPIAAFLGDWIAPSCVSFRRSSASDPCRARNSIRRRQNSGPIRLV
jgi:Mn2+/Fe2+ NRAMP family transporter